MDKSVVVAGAVRTTVGRRDGGWAAVHPARLLGAAQRAVLDRTGVDPALVGQVVGGTVTQVGEQSFNLARTAWLAEGLPQEVAATTVDAQCGSSQQAFTLAMALLAVAPAHPAAWDMAWRIALRGLGFGIFGSTNMRAIMSSAPRERSGAVGGINTSFRLLGQASGTALVAVMFRTLAAGHATRRRCG